MLAVSTPVRPGSNACRFAGRLHLSLRLKRCCLYLFKASVSAGVLAFLFAVVSPDDDLTQQEFVRTRPAQVLLLGCKASRPSCSANATRSAIFLPVWSVLLCTVRELACNASVSVSPMLISSSAGLRSPPLCP
jgi:hypothetical protein